MCMGWGEYFVLSDITFFESLLWRPWFLCSEPDCFYFFHLHSRCLCVWFDFPDTWAFWGWAGRLTRCLFVSSWLATSLEVSSDSWAWAVPSFGVRDAFWCKLVGSSFSLLMVSVCGVHSRFLCVLLQQSASLISITGWRVSELLLPWIAVHRLFCYVDCGLQIDVLFVYL